MIGGRRAALRSALSMAVIVASRFNRILRQSYNASRPPKARKLAIIANFRSKTPDHKDSR